MAGPRGTQRGWSWSCLTRTAMRAAGAVWRTHACVRISVQVPVVQDEVVPRQITGMTQLRAGQVGGRGRGGARTGSRAEAARHGQPLRGRKRRTATSASPSARSRARTSAPISMVSPGVGGEERRQRGREDERRETISGRDANASGGARVRAGRARSASSTSASTRSACGRSCCAAALGASPSGVRVKRRAPTAASIAARRRPTVVEAGAARGRRLRDCARGGRRGRSGGRPRRACLHPAGCRASVHAESA